MGSLLSQPITEQHSGQASGTLMSCGYTSMQGWRRSMEDAHIVNLDFTANVYEDPTSETPKEVPVTGTLLAVFDGHGGENVAKFCEEAFLTVLKKQENFKKRNYAQALIDTNIMMDEEMKDDRVNDHIVSLASQSTYYNDMIDGPIATGMGCTAVVCLIIENTLYLSNAGDSRAVLLCNNEVIALSTDHKPHLESESERIMKAGGYISNGRVNANLNLTRTLGDLMYKRDPQLKPEEQIISCYPDIHQHQLNGNEQILILACDGIWDCLTNEMCVKKVLKYLEDGLDLKQTVEHITMDCLAVEPFSQPGWDNMTLIVGKFNGFHIDVKVNEKESIISSAESTIMEEE